ncbi:MAG: hypothetical protein K0U66_04200 [Gammaproteobacteria bacterium]|nr:hypothetical protein [Gammaproteobacteria bacterium]
MPSETARQIEAVNREIGLLVPVSYDGKVEGESGDYKQQPDVTTSVYMEVIEQKVESDGASGRRRTIQTSLSAVGAYVPLEGHRMTLFGVTYTITEVLTDTLGVEVDGYRITGVA